MLSAKKTQAIKNAIREWKDEWTKEHYGRELYKLEPSPRKKTIKLYYRLNKELSSLVVQMQTGKITFGNFFSTAGY